MKKWAGFTMIELVVTIVIIGILAVVAAPRFFDDNVFKSRGFADQVQSVLRFAQKEAIAQHRNVCVALTAASISLTIANASGAASACVSPLSVPSAAPATANQIFASAGITMNYTSASFNFDALGRTPSQQTITVNGTTKNIIVEAETGYVHSP